MSWQVWADGGASAVMCPARGRQGGKSYNLSDYDRLRHGFLHCSDAFRRRAHDPATASPLLKLHADKPNNLNTVTSYGPGYIEINLVRHDQSVLVMPEGPVEPWPVARFEDLEPAHFDVLLDKQAEVVLLGTGNKLRFPHPRLTAALARRHIGVDAMDLQAACRTYNILMAEGRKVAAILLVEPVDEA